MRHFSPGKPLTPLFLQQTHTTKKGLLMYQTIEFIKGLTELSQQHHFEIRLNAKISDSKITLNASYLRILLLNVDNYLTLPFSKVRDLEEDITGFLSEYTQDTNTYVQLEAVIPQVVEETDWDDDDYMTFYSDYLLFDDFYGNQSNKAKHLMLEDQIGHGTLANEDYVINIENGKAELINYDYRGTASHKTAIRNYQRNVELVQTLAQLLDGVKEYVPNTTIETESTALSKTMKTIQKHIGKLDELVTNGQLVTNRRLTFNYASMTGGRSLFAGVVFNVSYIRPDYDILNRVTYPKITEDFPLYFNIIRDDMENRTTFGHNHQPALSIQNLRNVNETNDLNLTRLHTVFATSYIKFEQIRQLYIDITEHKTITNVIYDGGDYYCYAGNQFVAQVDVNYGLYKKVTEEDKNDVKEMIQSFIDNQF